MTPISAEEVIEKAKAALEFYAENYERNIDDSERDLPSNPGYYPRAGQVLAAISEYERNK